MRVDWRLEIVDDSKSSSVTQFLNPSQIIFMEFEHSGRPEVTLSAANADVEPRTLIEQLKGSPWVFIAGTVMQQIEALEQSRILETTPFAESEVDLDAIARIISGGVIEILL